MLGLTWAVLGCNESTTLDDFGTGILVEDGVEDYFNIAEQDERSDVCFQYAVEIAFESMADIC